MVASPFDPASILISLALQKPIYQDLAMTGQISSKGEIGRRGVAETEAEAKARGERRAKERTDCRPRKCCCTNPPGSRTVWR